MANSSHARVNSLFYCSSTYNPSLSGDEIADCLDCTAGYYCPDNEMHTPLACEKGYFSASGATACTVCEAGYYCDSNTTSEVFMYTERVCPAGQECAAGSITQPDLVSKT